MNVLKYTNNVSELTVLATQLLEQHSQVSFKKNVFFMFQFTIKQLHFTMTSTIIDKFGTLVFLIQSLK